MRLQAILSIGALSFLLVGCSDTLSDIKDAASGINSKADEAATAISQDAHSVRAIELLYNDRTATIDDLFKSTLRDVQWQFDKETNHLTVTGTWQPTLFAEYGLTEELYEELAVIGEVIVSLMIEDHTVQQEHTTLKVLYKDEILLEKQGNEVLHSFFEEYIKK